MASEITEEKSYPTEDGVEIDTSKLTQDGKAQLASLKFVDELLIQKNNELEIADSARVVYYSVFKLELNMIK